MREKVGKSRFTVFFQWFVAPEGRKEGSLKRRVRILNFTSSWDFVIFREYWISRSRCNIWCSIRAQGSHEKLKRHGLHGFALDQPSINGIGPINRSEKMKRSETVGNMIRPKLVQHAFLLKINISAQGSFFFWRSKGVQGETVGNSRRSHLRSAKK